MSHDPFSLVNLVEVVFHLTLRLCLEVSALLNQASSHLVFHVVEQVFCEDEVVPEESILHDTPRNPVFLNEVEISVVQYQIYEELFK
jgi:hypothetical protein